MKKTNSKNTQQLIVYFIAICFCVLATTSCQEEKEAIPPAKITNNIVNLFAKHLLISHDFGWIILKTIT